MDEFELIRGTSRGRRSGRCSGRGRLRAPAAQRRARPRSDDRHADRRSAFPCPTPKAARARTLGARSQPSDLAAMGATPRWVTLALALPAADPAWLEAFSGGFYALAERYGVDLIGGDTTRAERRAISITAIGEVPRNGARALARTPGRRHLGFRRARRRGARPRAPGDRRGGEAPSLPEPRVELGERLRGLARGDRHLGRARGRPRPHRRALAGQRDRRV